MRLCHKINDDIKKKVNKIVRCFWKKKVTDICVSNDWDSVSNADSGQSFLSKYPTSRFIVEFRMKKYGSPGLVVTHFLSWFLYFFAFNI